MDEKRFVDDLMVQLLERNVEMKFKNHVLKKDDFELFYSFFQIVNFISSVHIVQ